MTNRLAITFLAALLTCGSAIAQQSKKGDAPQPKKGDATEGTCLSNFTINVGNFMAQPNGAFQTVTHNCTGPWAGCQDYFDITCPAGGTLDLSFCQGGGNAFWDTSLSTWSGPPGFTTLVVCNDDFCGFQSQLTSVLPVATTFRARVGGFNGSSGPYTLAYRAPLGCTIATTPVEVIEFDVK
jgi:hypothetical protein